MQIGRVDGMTGQVKLGAELERGKRKRERKMRYQSKRHRKIVLHTLALAGQEIMRGWHEEAGTPPEDLDPDMPLAAQGDVDFLNDTMEHMTGDIFPWHLGSPSKEMRAVREGMQDYVDTLDIENVRG